MCCYFFPNRHLFIFKCFQDIKIFKLCITKVETIIVVKFFYGNVSENMYFMFSVVTILQTLNITMQCVRGAIFLVT